MTPNLHVCTRFFICLSLLLGTSCLSLGDFITHTTLASFQTANTGRATNTINFDSVTAPTPVSNSTFFQSQVRFELPNLLITDGRTGFPAGSGDPISTLDGLNTISGSFFLGSTTGGDLIDRSMNLTFSNPINAIGMYFVTFEQLDTTDASLQVGSTIGNLSPANEIVLAGTGKTSSFAYFVGITQTDPSATFTTARIQLGTSFPVRIGLDNVITAVPEPNSLLLYGLWGVGLVGYKRLRKLR
jgi:hypothetical protein